MKKLLNIVISVLIALCILTFGVGIFVGNYVYDYILNPTTSNFISDFLETNKDKQKDAQAWLDENALNTTITSEDGLSLNGYYIDKKSSTTVIMVHGYRGNAASITYPVKIMDKQDYNMLIVDLRGHGYSEGNYIGMGWDERQDILSWIDYILDIDERTSIILYGVSMGAATVMNTLSEELPPQVKGIIEDCGYTDVESILGNQIGLGGLPGKFIFKMTSLVTKFRSGYYLSDVEPIEQVKKSTIPILFIHGDKDTFVPTSMVYELYEAATCEKELLVIEGAGHANSCSTDPESYFGAINNFIRKHK